MKKTFIAMTLALFATHAAYSASILAVDPVPPADGYQAAKNSEICSQDWTTNSKGNTSVLFDDGKGYKRSFKKMEYIEACKKGKLPVLSSMK
ncbi:MAG: hypothetical protein Q8L85_09420 [Alphaproteobacteria bacterium]|nr:hypothetical protein [Alphaproteobacteria bacterium]